MNKRPLMRLEEKIAWAIGLIGVWTPGVGIHIILYFASNPGSIGGTRMTTEVLMVGTGGYLVVLILRLVYLAGRNSRR